jgi:carnitine-CoA ligase
MDAIGNRSLRDLLNQQAMTHGDRIFIVHETAQEEITELSYAELNKQAQQYAEQFVSMGLKKGDHVFVFLRNTPDFVPIWFGLLSAGLVMVPGNIYLTESEVEYQLRHCAPALIITEDQFAGLIQKSADGLSPEPQFCLETDLVRIAILERNSVSSSPKPELPAIDGDDLAQVLYTSGTSARPKGVLLTHANFLWAGLSSALQSCFTPEDRVFNNKPLFHANCQDTVLSCLTAGATVIIGERYSATRYISQLIKHQATVCSLSGMLCRTLLNQPESTQDRAHKIRFAGYAINISQDEIDRFTNRFGIRIRNGYGQSEAMLYISFQSVTEPSTYPSIGRPCLDKEVFIANEDNQALPVGQVGEIVVRGRRGRNIMLGYLNDPAATAAAFAGGWLHTGDMGYFDEAGNLYFFGRIKEVIKRAGENISAAEVEEVIISHPDVSDVAVVGVPDPIRDQAVMACVVLREPEALSEEALMAYCKASLAYFKVPTIVKFLDALPRNASGKLVKRQLIELQTHG